MLNRDSVETAKVPAWVLPLPAGEAPFNQVGRGVSALKPATPDRFFHRIDSSAITDQVQKIIPHELNQCSGSSARLRRRPGQHAVGGRCGRWLLDDPKVDGRLGARLSWRQVRTDVDWPNLGKRLSVNCEADHTRFSIYHAK